MTADQSSPVAAGEPCPTDGCPGDGRYAAPGRGHAVDCRYPMPTVVGDAGGGDVEALAEAICEAHEPEEDLAPGENFPCHACIGEARVILPAVRALLRAARAEGAREALEGIEPALTALIREADRDGDEDYADGLRAARTHTLARAASVGRGGVEGDESAIQGAVGDAQVSGEGFGDQETQGRENGDSA